MNLWLLIFYHADSYYLYIKHFLMKLIEMITILKTCLFIYIYYFLRTINFYYSFSRRFTKYNLGCINKKNNLKNKV